MELMQPKDVVVASWMFADGSIDWSSRFVFRNCSRSSAHKNFVWAKDLISVSHKDSVTFVVLEMGLPQAFGIIFGPDMPIHLEVQINVEIGSGAWLGDANFLLGNQVCSTLSCKNLVIQCFRSLNLILGNGDMTNLSSIPPVLLISSSHTMFNNKLLINCTFSFYGIQKLPSRSLLSHGDYSKTKFPQRRLYPEEGSCYKMVRYNFALFATSLHNPVIIIFIRLIYKWLDIIVVLPFSPANHFINHMGMVKDRKRWKIWSVIWLAIYRLGNLVIQE
ncbi:hypothetical protein Lal_00000748 [Lupinus albus]|nr:hypothetical protein Lal_00000748 [Lupinus albus]